MEFDWRKKEKKEIVEFVVHQQSRLETIRAHFEPVMDLVTKLFLPRTWDMRQSRPMGQEAYGVSIYDHTPSEARRKFAAGFVSHTATKREEAEQSWINFTSVKSDLMKVDRVRQFMQDAAEQERSGFSRSTFYRETAYQQQIGDASVLWGVMTIEEDLARDRLVFRRRDPRNHWFSEDMFGDIDVDHFKHTFTAAKLVEQFEEAELPDVVTKQTQGDKNPYAEYQVIQAIYRNGSRRAGSTNDLDMPFIQFYVLLSGAGGKDKQLIETKGLRWRPSVLRIGERLDSGYPMTMAMDALTAATYGNTLAKHGLMGSHAMMDPPRLIHESLRDQIRKHRLRPASNTYYRTNEEKIEYLSQKVDPTFAEELLRRENKAVDERFYVNFFELITGIMAAGGTPPTATQIRQAVGERIGQMTPVIESSEDDSLEPSVDAVWQYESAARRMPPPPQELVDQAEDDEIRVLSRYNGNLAQLKRTLRQNQGIVEALALIREYKEIFPSGLVIVKQKKLLEKMLVNRIGQDNIHSDQEVLRIEEELAELGRQERQLEQSERMAKMIPSVTKDAVDPNSPAMLARAG